MEPYSLMHFLVMNHANQSLISTPTECCAVDFNEQHTANSMDTKSSVAEEALQSA